MSIVQLNLPDDVLTLAWIRAAESGHADLEQYPIALIRADAGQDVSPKSEQTPPEKEARQ